MTQNINNTDIDIEARTHNITYTQASPFANPEKPKELKSPYSQNEEKSASLTHCPNFYRNSGQALSRK